MTSLFISFQVNFIPHKKKLVYGLVILWLIVIEVRQMGLERGIMRGEIILFQGDNLWGPRKPPEVNTPAAFPRRSSREQG